jgi:hypothetical protein
VFGPITEPGAYEDSVLFTRGRLLGSVEHVPKALVRYRQGGHSRGDDSVAWRLRRTEVAEAVLRQRQKDIDTFARWLSAEIDAELAETGAQLTRLRNRLAGATDPVR